MNQHKVNNHIEHLERKHEALETLVRQMYNDNATDEEIHDLKKRKLEIRDEIEECKRHIP